jgi:hypothetical protein
METPSASRRAAALTLAALATLATFWSLAEYAYPPPGPVTVAITAGAR